MSYYILLQPLSRLNRVREREHTPLSWAPWTTCGEIIVNLLLSCWPIKNDGVMSSASWMDAIVNRERKLKGYPVAIAWYRKKISD
jgi:hypothetical protein